MPLASLAHPQSTRAFTRMPLVYTFTRATRLPPKQFANLASIGEFAKGGFSIQKPNAPSIFLQKVATVQLKSRNLSVHVL